METFWFFWLRLRCAYDSAYDSDFLFSQGHKRSYHSTYDSYSDSVARENQPRRNHVLFTWRQPRKIKLDAKFENTAVFPALLCMFSGFHVLLIQKHFDTLECFQ